MRGRSDPNRRTIVRDGRLKKKTFQNSNSSMQGDMDYLQMRFDNDWMSFKTKMNTHFEKELRAAGLFDTASGDSFVQNQFFLLYKDWKFFNGMVGVYYTYYNDGSTAAEAIENNRTSYENLGDMLFDPFRPRERIVESFLCSTEKDEDLLEAAMKATVYHYMNDNRLKNIRGMRSESLGACFVCNSLNPQFKTRNPNDGRVYCSKNCFKKNYN